MCSTPGWKVFSAPVFLLFAILSEKYSNCLKLFVQVLKQVPVTSTTEDVWMNVAYIMEKRYVNARTRTSTWSAQFTATVIGATRPNTVNKVRVVANTHTCRASLRRSASCSAVCAMECKIALTVQMKMQMCAPWKHAKTMSLNVIMDDVFREFWLLFDSDMRQCLLLFKNRISKRIVVSIDFSYKFFQI